MKEIGLHQREENLQMIGRCVVYVVLLELTKDDPIAAGKAFKEWGNCCEVEEVHLTHTTVQIYHFLVAK